jgi:addiction module HigA family antidote
MEMFNPPHPGEILLEIFLIPQKISESECAEKLGLSLSDMRLLLHGKYPINARLASQLARTLGSSTETWLAMQRNYEAWLAKQARIPNK